MYVLYSLFMPILTTSGMVLIKAGKHVDAAFRNISGAAELIGFISGAEAKISAEARYNFITNYSSLNSQTRLVLDDCVSSYAANFAIAYDMAQYTSRVEAESMINWNTKVWDDSVKLLKEKKVSDFLITGSSQ